MIVSIGPSATSLVWSTQPSCPIPHAAFAEEGGDVVVADRGAGAEGHELWGTSTGSFYAQKGGGASGRFLPAGALDSLSASESDDLQVLAQNGSVTICAGNSRSICTLFAHERKSGQSQVAIYPRVYWLGRPAVNQPARVAPDSLRGGHAGRAPHIADVRVVASLGGQVSESVPPSRESSCGGGGLGSGGVPTATTAKPEVS